MEIETSDEEVTQISSRGARKVDRTLAVLQPLIVSIGRHVAATCQQLARTAEVREAEIEMGLSFEAEGNLYITKSTTGANLLVRLRMTPPSVLDAVSEGSE